jgi:hypothetical protein
VDLGAVGQRRREVLVAVEDVGLVDDIAVDEQARLVEDDLRAVEVELDLVAGVRRAVADGVGHGAATSRPADRLTPARRAGTGGP